jgi:hypothetical protein
MLAYYMDSSTALNLGALAVIAIGVVIALLAVSSRRGRNKARLAKGERPRPRFIIRSYRGSQAEATRNFREDSVRLASAGYFPTTQTWAPGQWGCGAFLLALVLCLVIIGIVALIYMLIVKPDGTLTVTYELRESIEEKTCPMCAESVKAAALVCRFCGHEFEPENRAGLPSSARTRP